jgi:glycosyltransferase involved in cell wall biosynthesis
VDLKTYATGSPQAILCFCHLRWNFVYQRPQHLMTRLQKRAAVHLWEEPLFEDRDAPILANWTDPCGVHVLTPLLPRGLDDAGIATAQRDLLNQYIEQQKLEHLIAWYYTPMALKFSGHLKPILTVFDCMDELSAFAGAPPELLDLERRLFAKADIVFTGGASLFASKRTQHGNVHLFASSIDREHFAAARRHLEDPPDQVQVPHPRIGFYGVLDERLDCELLKQVAENRREWHFILVGPVVKIREEDLPRGSNIHYPGQKNYSQLPAYLGNWDVAMLPFAQNTSTKFISPTKTPEYLAAAKPVVSTPIRDVVSPYGEMGLVRIAEDAAEFEAAIEASLSIVDNKWLEKIDEFLAGTSWDKTFEGMWREIQRCMPQETASSA